MTQKPTSLLILLKKLSELLVESKIILDDVLLREEGCILRPADEAVHECSISGYVLVAILITLFECNEIQEYMDTVIVYYYVWNF